MTWGAFLVPITHSTAWSALELRVVINTEWLYHCASRFLFVFDDQPWYVRYKGDLEFNSLWKAFFER